MSDTLYWALIVIFGGFFFGLLVYGFYIVLTSKSNYHTDKKPVNKSVKSK